MDAVLKCLTEKEEDLKNRVSVEVFSAVPLSADLKKQMVQKLQKYFSRKVLLKEKPPSQKWIGGIRIQSQGRVFDDTLWSHLHLMESKIRRKLYEDTSE